VLNRSQQAVGQDTQEDVRLRPVFRVMEDGPLHQRTLDVPECVLDARQKNVSTPDLVCRQMILLRLPKSLALDDGTR